MMRWQAMSCWLLAAMLMALAGCSKQAPTAAATPEQLWSLFDAAMKAGQPERAAELVDYKAQATEENSDVENVSKSGKNLMAGKMKEATVSGLRGLNYPAEGMKAGAPVTQGGRATVTASGGGKTLTLQLAQSDAGWRIVGGVPGMTSAAN